MLFDPCPVEPAVKPERRIIERAIKMIDQPEKWCKRVGYSNGRRCIDAALLSAGTHETLQSVRTAERAVEHVVGRKLVDYNDDPATTHAMVIAALRQAAFRV